MALQETMMSRDTKLKDGSEIKFNDYNIFQKYCGLNRRGVAILVRTDILADEIDISSNLEHITVKVFYRNKYMSVTSLYLSPSIPFEVKDLENLNRKLLNKYIVQRNVCIHDSNQTILFML